MFDRARRLSLKEEFDRVFAHGQKYDFQKMVVRTKPADQARLGLVVPRQFGNAVHRNRFKRKVRAAFRKNQSTLPKADIVVCARHGWKDVTTDEINSALRTISNAVAASDI